MNTPKPAPEKLRVVLADDESLCREGLRDMLEPSPIDGCAVEVLAECDCGTEAVEAVKERRPDLLFLDVRMPDLDGFGVLDRLSRELDGPLPLVVFVTALDEAAVRAFEAHAMDYLLKPPPPERVADVLTRAAQALKQRRLQEEHSKLLAWLSEERPPAPSARPGPWLSRIEVRGPDRWDYVPVSEILWMRADGNYVELRAAEKTHLIRETLQVLETQLDPAQFLRVGRSVIVNLGAVRSVLPQGRSAPMVELSDGTTLAVQRNLEELQRRLRYARS